MNKLFLDSDVLLDFLLERPPFIEEITAIIEVSLTTDVALCISPITITNIDYIIGSLENREKAAIKRKKLLQLFHIETVEQNTIHQASDSAFRDFEDAVQNYCAKAAGHQIIITRNTKDYKESDLAIMTPKEYLAKLKSEK